MVGDRRGDSGDDQVGVSVSDAPAAAGVPAAAAKSASSPMSWKSYSYPASVPIARAKRNGDGIDYLSLEHDAPRLA